MPRRLAIGLTVALLGMPVGVSWAQTSTSSYCQLPGLECITLNPPPRCPPTPPPNGVAVPFMTTGGTTGTGRTIGGTTPGLARPIPGQPTVTG